MPGGDLGDGDLLGVDAAKGVKGMMFSAVSLVLELPMGPRMVRSIFFWANPIFRSAKVLVFFSGVTFLSFSKGIFTVIDFLIFSKGILAMMDFLGDFLGDLLGDFLGDFFFLPKGNLTISFSLLGNLGDFLLGNLGKRIRSGGTRGGETCGDTWSGDVCGEACGEARGTRIRSGGTLFFFWVSHLNK